jgi:hypothetical protein
VKNSLTPKRKGSVMRKLICLGVLCGIMEGISGCAKVHAQKPTEGTLRAGTIGPEIYLNGEWRLLRMQPSFDVPALGHLPLPTDTAGGAPYCEDKTRFLLMSDDGVWHCLDFKVLALR